ncbi:sigma 54-interacting transcriptional regulator [Fusibacter paucivorans]|uniref:Sigma 54-interacting transcriptional regulator n=1 Tax=Fusibacter paucivorans TaxID=76009 RepID=A0ABS5PVF5_9FIRM|nr:sigma 54-interacting transcriptional regulator [Fusibacter paucivorans]MBS7528661.1 sigma 54-interacting transcriptional regulator [Fusibacter paucivorans]
MNNTLYSRWIQLHNDSNLRKNLPDKISDSWYESFKANVDPTKSVPFMYSKKDFEKVKEKSKSIYIHANYVLERMYKCMPQSNLGLVLFDKNACLLKLYGSDSFMTWAKENYLAKGVVLSESVVGTNAVSLGLRHRQAISVVGEEHFSKFAIEIASYFSPVILELDKNEMIVYGGVAIIGPVSEKDSNLLVTAIAISREINLQMFWFNNLTTLTSAINGYGIIGVDQSSGKNHVLFSNKNLFDILSIPPVNIYYNTLEKIIDPSPKNKKFWKIINNSEIVTDMTINLSINNHQIYVSMSTTPFFEQKFHIKGLSIHLNSTERLNNLISNHTGNNARFTFATIVGQSENYLEILNHAKAAAFSSSNILLLGESGVGKDVIAQAIHNESPRRNKPFIAINCAALPKDLISTEFFGYAEGAFTGSKKGGNVGKFELANHGTIFLDEIGDMPLDLQATLLRVIEQKSFMRIGSNISTKLDVRIIAATNKNLMEKIKQKEFREDLFYRLAIIRINIPPLRERTEDILLLADNFIHLICERINKAPVKLSPEVKDFFINYNWPGNVRELQNLLEGTLQIYNDKTITLHRIQHYFDTAFQLYDPSKTFVPPERTSNTLAVNRDTGTSDEKEALINALNLNKYNKTRTAKYLGISRRTLYRKLNEHDLL